MISYKNSLTKDDLKQIGMNILVFNVPVFLLAVITGLSAGEDIKNTLLIASTTLLTAVIDTITKFRETRLH